MGTAMPRAPLLLPPFAVPALLPLGRAAFAGPPEGVSGSMVLVDRVADGLRQYRQESDPARRIERLTALAATRDPRVALGLGELLERGQAAPRSESPDTGVADDVLLHAHCVPDGGGTKQRLDCWKRNEADLRRRARLLPQ
jgi:hypothetical protein